MCGILGWAINSSRRQALDTLRNLTDRLVHRGPDGAGYWLDDTADGGYQIALGHRRLSIIDIQCGAQPMWTPDRTLAIVFNGEIYNYLELRDELIAKGHHFRTDSDTEVLLASYREWGIDALRRFRGMFAFALWDAAQQQLMLARDPFGKKPLFVAEMPTGLVFASEINPLLEFPGIDRTLDDSVVGGYLVNRYVPGPDTFFRGVKKLQPGCYAMWRNGTTHMRRYWSPPLVSTRPDIAKFDDAVSEFETVFDDSVRIRMRSDAPYGAYLSGGIDSSAVVATMARHSTQPLRTFSVGFAERAYSELQFARMIADHFRTDHHELVVTPNEFIEVWPTAIEHRAAPVAEASDIPIMMLSRMASDTVKMVLTGEGADELFGGYPKHRAEGLIERYQRLMPPAIHDWLIAPAIRRLPYGARRIKIMVAAGGERRRQDRMRLWFGGTSTAECEALMGRASSPPAHDEDLAAAPFESPMRRALLFDQTSWLPDNLLERGDRMMMAASVEGRMPFMDIELAKLAARLPDQFLLGRRGGKAVLRAAMDRVLPKKIIARKKVGFRVPFNAWFRGPQRDLLKDHLVSSDSRVAGLCNRGVLRQLVDDHVDGRQNNEKILWSLVNLDMFLRIFDLRTDVP
ncbi:MAG TPA: asparagine synthase (glutamine-hydrolyzing) [Gemmatimonadaceae bacterium]